MEANGKLKNFFNSENINLDSMFNQFSKNKIEKYNNK